MPSAVDVRRRAFHLPEPRLEFAGGQTASDPHDGLALHGPFSAGSPSHPQTPGYIVVAPPEGIESMSAWACAMNQPFGADAKSHRLWPPYPGFEVAFGSRWSENATATFELSREELLLSSRKSDAHARAFAVTNLFLDALEKAKKVDAQIGVAVCVIPDEVFANCRTESRILNPTDTRLSRSEKTARQHGQTDLFEQFDPEQYLLSPDFRRQLKARSMRFDIPVQIIQESTLRLTDDVAFGERTLTPLSDRMWNLGTALYYKSGGKPWKLHGAREGVCYIGIAFRRGVETASTACCAAQMFLDSGDGIVFLGEYGPWYSPDRKQFQLSRDGARQLLDGVLTTYRDMGGKHLSEVFLHCRSSLGKEAFGGFRDACPQDCKLVGIRVRSEPQGRRLYRLGTRPVLRGTVLRLNDRACLLYAAGFKPRLGTYDGWETPVPLRVDVEHGTADIEQVARDILGLTKLNYNACKLGDSQPVTVGFSDAVGEILISNPTVSERRPNFKYYI